MFVVMANCMLRGDGGRRGGGARTRTGAGRPQHGRGAGRPHRRADVRPGGGPEAAAAAGAGGGGC